MRVEQKKKMPSTEQQGVLGVFEVGPKVKTSQNI